MRLINLSKKGDTYTVKAKTSYKLFGLTLSSTVQEYVKPVSEENWYDIQGKKTSEKKKMLLNKWLKDHKRFIE